MNLHLICLYLWRRLLEDLFLFFLFRWKELIYYTFVLSVSLKPLFVVRRNHFMLWNSKLGLCQHRLIFSDVAKLLLNCNFLLSIWSWLYRDIGFPSFLALFFLLDFSSRVAFVHFTIVDWVDIIFWRAIHRI